MTRTSPQKASVSDTVWLVRFANGDPEAARVLTARLAPRAFRLSYRILGDQAEAEDIAQEAMLRLWQQAPEWRQDGPAQPATWLLRVARNLCIDRLRQTKGRKATHGSESLDTLPGAQPTAEMLLTQKDRSRVLRAALAELPDRQRDAIVLRHIDECGNAEIAGIMDISVEAVESLLARGKRALSAKLAGRAEELGFRDDEQT
ncbi:MAG: sigma-70 family RNA polymerase sigma factor [Dinoroseobacter sp.]|nr:sigma-70 family RNA polymerase sigma factor [Dinoroseobacter sp.]